MSHKGKSDFRGAGSPLAGDCADCGSEHSRLFQSTYGGPLFMSVSTENIYCYRK